MKNLLVRSTLTFIATLACLGGHALAATESFSSSILTDVGVGGPQQVAIQGFDPSLGTLTSVSFAFNGDADFTLSAKGSTAANVPYTDSSSFSLTLTAPNGNFLSISPQSGTLSGTAPSSDDPDFQTSQSPASTFSLPISSGLADFESASSINFSVTTANELVQGSPSTLTYSADDTFDGSMHVTYTFTAVPEPSTLAYLPLAVVALALLRLRRRA